MVVRCTRSGTPSVGTPGSAAAIGRKAVTRPLPCSNHPGPYNAPPGPVERVGCDLPYFGAAFVAVRAHRDRGHCTTAPGSAGGQHRPDGGQESVDDTGRGVDRQRPQLVAHLLAVARG